MGQHTHLIHLRAIVLVSFDLFVPVIVVGKIPSGDGLVIKHGDSDCVDWV